MVFDASIFDPTIFLTPDTPSPPLSGNFSVYQNGVEKSVAWSRAQLLSISLAMAAYDGQVGTGAVTLPGAPEDAGGWQIGDRISFVDEIAGVLYTGYLMRPQVEENPDAVLELQTNWQLMDINRLLIGIRVTEDQDHGPEYFWQDGGFWTIFPGDAPTIDVLTWVDDWTADLSFVPPIIYDSDGATAWVNDVIRFTGWTVYLSPTSVENELQLHVHDLNAGPGAGINATQVGTDVDADTFAIGSPIRTIETSDIKDGFTLRNGVVIIPSSPVGTYSQGGIGWEAALDFSVDEDGLVLISANLSATGADPKPTYSFNLFNLDGLKVAATRAGSLIGLNSLVFNTTGEPKRISHETLTVSRDEAGNPRPGFWDLAIEADFPQRNPTAVPGFGGQGNQLGALTSYRQWVRTEVVEDNPGILVGETETARAQLLDKDDIATPVANVTIAWSVVQNDYDDLHDDYQPAADTSLTDESGAAYMVIGHNFDLLPTVKHRVKAEPG